MKLIIQTIEGAHTVETGDADCTDPPDRRQDPELSRKIQYANEACRGLSRERTVEVMRKVVRGHHEHNQRIEDIPGGEMQDECKRELGEDFSVCEECKFKTVCNQMEKAPAFWDLSDPPRFNEAQMALLRMMMDMGAEYATQRGGSVGFYTGAPMRRVALIDATILDDGSTACLAELFGDASK